MRYDFLKGQSLFIDVMNDNFYVDVGARQFYGKIVRQHILEPNNSNRGLSIDKKRQNPLLFCLKGTLMIQTQDLSCFMQSGQRRPLIRRW